MDKTVEMEMKLTIARRDLKKLLASELITATMIKGSLAKQELLTTYYDTASYKLTESGWHIASGVTAKNMRLQ